MVSMGLKEARPIVKGPLHEDFDDDDDIFFFLLPQFQPSSVYILPSPTAFTISPISLLLLRPYLNSTPQSKCRIRRMGLLQMGDLSISADAKAHGQRFSLVRRHPVVLLHVRASFSGTVLLRTSVWAKEV